MSDLVPVTGEVEQDEAATTRWGTADGRVITVREMTDDHLRNVIFHYYASRMYPSELCLYSDSSRFNLHYGSVRGNVFKQHNIIDVLRREADYRKLSWMDV